MTTSTSLKEICQTAENKKYYDIHINRFSFILNTVKNLKLPPQSQVLDVGCYPPHLFNSFLELGFQVKGVSSSHETIKAKNIYPINIETDNLPFEDNSFDLIVFSEVLEHLIEYPSLFFNEVSRVLKKNGYFLLTTPNALRTQNIFLLLLKQNIYPPLDQFKSTKLASHTIYHRHNREYTLSELINIFPKNIMTTIKASCFISFSPFREKNKSDSFIQKFLKTTNFLLMLIFPSRKDTLFLLYQKQ
ncbi:MAG: class I SAM-dependent methyltransferase [Patescibacteria group bacterium]|jgi:SAM-dependent methyltransferase